MRKIPLKIFMICILFATLFVGVSSSSAFASVKATRVHSIVRDTYLELCEPDPFTSGPYQSPQGNTSDCSDLSFTYAPQRANKPRATWTFRAGAGMRISTCSDIEAWIPFGNNAADTNVRYDFWADNSTHWLGWVGKDINQNNYGANGQGAFAQIGGLYGSAVDITWNPQAIGNDLEVTAQDDGGRGNIGFAAMKFTCTVTSLEVGQ